MRLNGKDLFGGPYVFIIDETAPVLLGEAHKRSAPWLRGPLVARHLGIWPIAAFDAQMQSDRDEARHVHDLWVAQVNGLLRALQTERFGWPLEKQRAIDFFAFKTPPEAYSELTEDGRMAVVEERDASGEIRRVPVKFHVNSIGFPIRWKGIDGLVQADLHREFLTLTVVLQRPKTREEGSLAALLSGSFARAVDPELGPQEARKLGAFLYEELWERVWEDIEALRAEFRPGAAASEGTGTVEPGRIFADFRSAVLVRRNPLTATNDERAPIHLWDSEGARQVLNDHAILVRGALAPDGEREFVGSRVLDGQAIHVSNLGSPTRRLGATVDDTDDPTDALTETHSRNLLLYENAPSHPQLGRLIERLNALGHSRLAALRDLDKIESASGQLRYLGWRLDEVASRQLSNQNPTSRAAILYEVEKIADELSRLGQVNGGQAIAHGGGLPAGGIAYRIARSARYVEVFETRLPHMRIQPIETWQSYEEFMRRRLSITFNYIKRVGDRRAALWDRVNVEISLLQTINMVKHADATNRAVNSTDVLAYLFVILSFMAVAVELDDATQAALWRWVTGMQPQELGIDPEWKKLLGAGAGAVLGGVVAVAIYLVRILYRSLTHRDE